jgi:hypothetical protein
MLGTWTQSNEETLTLLRSQGLSYAKIAEQMGLSKRSVESKWKRMNSEQDKTPVPTDESFEKTETEDCAVITSKSSTVRTLAGALETANVDLSIWEVEKHTINKWDCVGRVESKEVSYKHWKRQLAAVELWQVKVWLRRKVPKVIEEGVKLFLSQIPAHKYVLPKFEHHSDPYLLEVSIWDHHFGKLAWGRETGQNYDLKIAETLYSNAAHELIEKARGFNLERIVVPIGQDFFHVDGPNNTTTAGTPQDVDGRLAKIFATGQKALINLIDLLMGIAPVHILWVPGNHDWYTSWYLIKVIEAHYRMTPSVTIDAGEMPRKHIEYGCNLLAYTHGNEEKHASLPAIMAGAWPQAWARTTHREWKIGHFHKVKETHYSSAETIDGVLVRVLPSLCGTDSWHFKKGYVGGMRAAQAFLYSQKNGYAGHINVNAKV